MRKNKFLVLLVIAAIVTAVLSGCTASEFSVAINYEQNAEITAKNAGKDMSAGAGGILVEEGQKIHIKPFLNKGEISLKFSPFDVGIEVSMDELKEAASGKNAVLEVVISGKDAVDHEIEPGGYFISAQVVSKADGKVLLSVR